MGGGAVLGYPAGTGGHLKLSLYHKCAGQHLKGCHLGVTPQLRLKAINGSSFHVENKHQKTQRDSKVASQGQTRKKAMVP